MNFALARNQSLNNREAQLLPLHIRQPPQVVIPSCCNRSVIVRPTKETSVFGTDRGGCHRLLSTPHNPAPHRIACHSRRTPGSSNQVGEGIGKNAEDKCSLNVILTASSQRKVGLYRLSAIRLTVIVRSDAQNLRVTIF